MSKTPINKRHILIFIILALCLLGVIAKLVELAVFEQQFLSSQAQAQSTKSRIIKGSRGEVLDRNGLPLAISVPVSDLILDPKVILNSKKYLKIISSLDNISQINISKHALIRKLKSKPKSRYLRIAKELLPQTSHRIKAMRLPGVHLINYERTFYPGGQSSSQIIGFTNENNKGQSALEKSLDKYLQPKDGKQTLITNAKGGVLSVIKVNKISKNGKDINLSIDQRIQNLTYQALKEKVIEVKAQSGSAVVLDPNTGEILAAVSYPSFDPNDRSARVGDAIRNRALTDRFEPGSTMKPFIIAAGLENKVITPDTIIDTRPGYYYIGKNRIKDDSNYGKLTPAEIIKKSSNIGASKVALMMPKEKLYGFLNSVGFGQPTGARFPAATKGYLPDLSRLGDFSYATISFGYGLSSSCLQLARAFSVFANGGKLYPASFLKLNYKPKGISVLPADISLTVRQMLYGVTSREGTGLLANIPGFDVAGKTGTAHQLKNGKYQNTYNAVFVGMAPLKNPRIVVVVRIDHPSRSYFDTFGGISAAPVFAKIAKGALRMLNIPMEKEHIDQKFFKDQKNYYRMIAGA